MFARVEGWGQETGASGRGRKPLPLGPRSSGLTHLLSHGVRVLADWPARQDGGGPAALSSRENPGHERSICPRLEKYLKRRAVLLQSHHPRARTEVMLELPSNGLVLDTLVLRARDLPMVEQRGRGRGVAEVPKLAPQPWGSLGQKPREFRGKRALGNLCLNYGPASFVSNLNLQTRSAR